MASSPTFACSPGHQCNTTKRIDVTDAHRHRVCRCSRWSSKLVRIAFAQARKVLVHASALQNPHRPFRRRAGARINVFGDEDIERELQVAQYARMQVQQFLPALRRKSQVPVGKLIGDPQQLAGDDIAGLLEPDGKSAEIGERG